MPVRFVIHRLKRFFIYRVMHVDDTPHRIALGLAVGIFIAWTPTVGFQMLLTVGLSALLRANKFVGVPFVWISNPFTLVPIYYPSYRLGCWMLGGKALGPNFLACAACHGGWIERIQTFWQATYHAMLPLWLGSLALAVVLGGLTYAATRLAVVRYRRHWHRKRDLPPWHGHAQPAIQAELTADQRSLRQNAETSEGAKRKKGREGK